MISKFARFMKYTDMVKKINKKIDSTKSSNILKGLKKLRKKISMKELQTREYKNKPRFIRKNGRIIPIRTKK